MNLKSPMYRPLALVVLQIDIIAPIVITKLIYNILY